MLFWLFPWMGHVFEAMAARIRVIKSMLREKNILVSGLLFLWQERKHHHVISRLRAKEHKYLNVNGIDISCQWYVHSMDALFYVEKVGIR